MVFLEVVCRCVKTFSLNGVLVGQLQSLSNFVLRIGKVNITAWGEDTSTRERDRQLMAASSWRALAPQRRRPVSVSVIPALFNFPAVCPGHLAQEDLVFHAPASDFRVGGSQNLESEMRERWGIASLFCVVFLKNEFPLEDSSSRLLLLKGFSVKWIPG